MNGGIRHYGLFIGTIGQVGVLEVVEASTFPAGRSCTGSPSPGDLLSSGCRLNSFSNLYHTNVDDDYLAASSFSRCLSLKAGLKTTIPRSELALFRPR